MLKATKLEERMDISMEKLLFSLQIEELRKSHTPVSALDRI